MSSSDKKYDDLTVIKGIGPARQRWLRESLNIVTFADLAALSVDEIESRLKADKQIASQNKIKAWIAQAREYAAAAAERAAQPTFAGTDAQAKKQANTLAEANESSPQTADSAKNDDGKEANTTTRKDGWKPFASFVVEFQQRTVEGQAIEYRTTAHHMEADTGANWPGIEREQHCLWMIEQVGDRIGPEPEEEERLAQERAAEPVPAARSPVKVEITQIQVFQPPQAENPVGSGQDDQPFEGLIKGNEPFALEIHFNLGGEAAAELTSKPAVCNASVYVQNQSTRESAHLGDADPGTLKKGKLAYTATLPEVALTPGTYRLLAFVTLQAASVEPDFVTLPELKVVRAG